MKRFNSRSFTLVELILASVIAATIMTAMITIWYSLVRSREKSNDRVEALLIQQFVYEQFTRDLRAATPPMGIFAGPFIGENDGEAGSGNLSFSCVAQEVGLGPDSGYRDVEYSLASSDEQEGEVDESGLALVRSERDSVLISDETEDAAQVLLEDIESFSLSYFDGEEWLEEWNSTTRNNQLPKAVRVTVGIREGEEFSFTQCLLAGVGN